MRQAAEAHFLYTTDNADQRKSRSAKRAGIILAVGNRDR